MEELSKDWEIVTNCLIFQMLTEIGDSYYPVGRFALTNHCILLYLKGETNTLMAQV